MCVKFDVTSGTCVVHQFKLPSTIAFIFFGRVEKKKKQSFGWRGKGGYRKKVLLSKIEKKNVKSGMRSGFFE